MLPASLPPHVVVAIQAAFALAAYGIVAKWYVLPALRARPVHEALPPLILPHLVRPVSLWLMVPGQIVERTIPTRFAIGTAYGDLAATLLAVLALVMLRRRVRGALVAVWIFNVVGSLDALRNIAMGMTTGAAAHMGAAGLVPAYAVPLLLVSHALIFKLLFDARKKR